MHIQYKRCLHQWGLHLGKPNLPGSTSRGNEQDRLWCTIVGEGILTRKESCWARYVITHTHKLSFSSQEKIYVCPFFVFFSFFLLSLLITLSSAACQEPPKVPGHPHPTFFSSLGRTGPPFRQSRPCPSKHFGAKLELLFVTNILICRLSSSFFFSSLFLSIRAALPNATSWTMLRRTASTQARLSRNARLPSTGLKRR